MSGEAIRTWIHPLHAVGVGVVTSDTQAVGILYGAVGVQVVAAPARIGDNGVGRHE